VNSRRGGRQIRRHQQRRNAAAARRRADDAGKVDFVLPPWSTGFNLAVAPIFAKYGYPQLAVTDNANDESDLVKQFPTLSFFLINPCISPPR
jgi:hypothetical protein